MDTFHAVSISRLSGDNEENLGSNRNSNQTLLFANGIVAVLPHTNWNSNLKISLLTDYFSLHNFNAVCILETYLDSTTTLDDNNFEIAGFITG